MKVNWWISFELVLLYYMKTDRILVFPGSRLAQSLLNWGNILLPEVQLLKRNLGLSWMG